MYTKPDPKFQYSDITKSIKRSGSSSSRRSVIQNNSLLKIHVEPSQKPGYSFREICSSSMCAWFSIQASETKGLCPGIKRSVLRPHGCQALHTAPGSFLSLRALCRVLYLGINLGNKITEPVDIVISLWVSVC